VGILHNIGALAVQSLEGAEPTSAPSMSKEIKSDDIIILSRLDNIVITVNFYIVRT